MFFDHRYASALAACVLAFAAAGCGDDASEDVAGSTDPTAAETTAPESSGADGDGTDGEPIKIALLYSETGRSASSYAVVDEVALAWADHVNSESGGINGHPVELLAYDVESDVSVAAQQAREAIEVDGAVAVVVQDSNTEAAVREYLVAQGVPVIGSTASHYEGSPNTEFAMSTTEIGLAASQPATAAALGATHFTAMVCSEVPGCASAAPFYEEHVESDFDLGYTPLITASHSEASYTAQCLSLVSSGADYMVLGFAPAIVPIIAEECGIQGFDGHFGVSGNGASGSQADLGIQLAGYINGFPWWADDPAVEEFRSVVGEAAPDADIRTSSATITWAALELFEKVITDYGPASGSPVTESDVIAAYYQVEDETLGGLLPMPLTFAEGEGSQPPVNCSWLFAVEDGDFTTVQVEGNAGNGATGDLKSWCWDS